MSLIEFFSLGNAASTRYPVTNGVPTSEANNDDAQDRKKLLDEAKHLNSSPDPSMDAPGTAAQIRPQNAAGEDALQPIAALAHPRT
jgi:hypothetical protein